MKIRTSLCLLVFCLSLCLPAQNAWAAADEEGWQTIEPGIDYREYTLDGPNRVFVARMDRSVENVILDTSIAQGRLAYGAEKVSDMAKRYDDAINFVEYPSGTPYGYRNNVAVAINGSFVIPNTSIPYSGVIQSGWYAKRFNETSGAAFGWKYDLDITKRQAFIGDCVFHRDHKQYVKNITTDDEIYFDGINISRPSNSMILYTSHYDTTTRTASDGIEVLVEMKRANLVISEPNGAKGVVVDVRDNFGSTVIPFDHIVLSAHGTAADILRAGISEGDEIEIDQEITSLDSDCDYIVSIPNWVKTFAGITGDHTFLKADVPIPHPDPTKNTDVHPRTAIAFNDQYIYFIVVDGRQPGVSIGMTYLQLAAFSQEYLEASWGLALDGGGSSTMVIDGLVMNIPSDPCTRRIFLPVIGANNPLDPDPESSRPDLSAAAETGFLPSLLCERRVGSGVMMIVLEDRLTSESFEPGNIVLNQVGAEVRLGPGTNYPLLATLSEVKEGTILHQVFDLDGIYAKGTYWWKVNFGTVAGWVSQDSLMLKPTSAFPN
jgi:hypothetical protein